MAALRQLTLALASTAALMAAVLGPVPARASRGLLQARRASISGTAIVFQVDHVSQDDSRRVLSVRTETGLVQVAATAEQLEGLITGLPVTVDGLWEKQPGSGVGPQPDSTGVLVAQYVSFTPPPPPPPPDQAPSEGDLVVEEGAVVGDTTASPASVTNYAPRVFNPVYAPELTTIVIPIIAVPAGAPATQSCPGTGPAPVSADVLQDTFFSADPTVPSVADTFVRCSYNLSRMTTANSVIRPATRLNCNGTTYGSFWTFNKCDPVDITGIADAADARLRAQSVPVDSYRHRVYLMPPGACNFIGMGYIGCGTDVAPYDCRVWIGSDFWNAPQAIVHELGHNLFNSHAYTDVGGLKTEYADDTCTMGFCCDTRCFNTPHAWQMGWVSVQQLTGANLVPGQTFNTTLTSQGLSRQSGMRIVPTWAPTATPTFLGFRTRVGGDRFIPPVAPDGQIQVNARVHVYSTTINGSMDWDVSYWRAGLAVGGRITLPGGVIVRRKPSNVASVAVVTICRPTPENATSCARNWDYDCDELAGADDPDCDKFRR